MIQNQIQKNLTLNVSHIVVVEYLLEAILGAIERRYLKYGEGLHLPNFAIIRGGRYHFVAALLNIGQGGRFPRDSRVQYGGRHAQTGEEGGRHKAGIARVDVQQEMILTASKGGAGCREERISFLERERDGDPR